MADNTYCNHCGKSNPADSKFCSQCGKAINIRTQKVEPQQLHSVTTNPLWEQKLQEIKSKEGRWSKIILIGGAVWFSLILMGGSFVDPIQLTVACVNNVTLFLVVYVVVGWFLKKRWVQEIEDSSPGFQAYYDAHSEGHSWGLLGGWIGVLFLGILAIFTTMNPPEDNDEKKTKKLVEDELDKRGYK